MSTPGGFRALVVDDEPPAVDELRFLLESDDAIAEVHTATRVSDAAAILSQGDIDVVFLDIDMPDVSGLELARMLRSLHQESHLFRMSGTLIPMACLLISTRFSTRFT